MTTGTVICTACGTAGHTAGDCTWVPFPNPPSPLAGSVDSIDRTLERIADALERIAHAVTP